MHADKPHRWSTSRLQTSELIPAPRPPQVRKLCCVCLVRAYASGDNLPMYSRVAALQGYLASKEVPDYHSVPDFDTAMMLPIQRVSL